MSNPPKQSCFAELSFGGQFLLWAVRNWCGAPPSDSSVQAMLRKGFELARLHRAFSDFDAFMTAISVSGSTAIDTRPPRCMTMSADEARLLGVIAAIQRDDEIGALAVLNPWTTPAGTRIAMRAAMRLAEAMSAVRLTLESKKRVLAVLHDDISGTDTTSWPAPSSNALH